ncbi:hypothetical protein [Roseomonas genomospecies 6]|uniref:Uncharacterized protein n=1 Tax=Roseomonas genomospecies 6 TaxID=214106 RepID=A0A9W7NJ93_9PROT|nr:hypothetical protein [Roseomonas genomospecies 6]KAA0680338.1 hypothetical protein DS843_13575 [Roseomonas genomospecies 6]
MAMKSILPEILQKLEPWLEEADAKWHAAPEGQRFPTLPITPDRKVNVRELVRLIGLKQSQEQHFFKKPELAAAVNAIADIQGVGSIGSRALEDAEDDAVRKRIRMLNNTNSDMAKTLAEQEAIIAEQRRIIDQLRAQLGLLEETGMTMRTEDVR